MAPCSLLRRTRSPQPSQRARYRSQPPFLSETVAASSAGSSSPDRSLPDSNTLRVLRHLRTRIPSTPSPPPNPTPSPNRSRFLPPLATAQACVRPPATSILSVSTNSHLSFSYSRPSNRRRPPPLLEVSTSTNFRRNLSFSPLSPRRLPFDRTAPASDLLPAPRSKPSLVTLWTLHLSLAIPSQTSTIPRRANVADQPERVPPITNPTTSSNANSAEPS
jgi:hypothetical protein